jgi:hypothetical protein
VCRSLSLGLSRVFWLITLIEDAIEDAVERLDDPADVKVGASIGQDGELTVDIGRSQDARLSAQRPTSHDPIRGTPAPVNGRASAPFHPATVVVPHACH